MGFPAVFYKAIWNTLFWLASSFLRAYNASYVKFLSEIHSSSLDCYCDWRSLSKIHVFLVCTWGFSAMSAELFCLCVTESHFSWQCVFVCLRAVRHMTLPIKPLYSGRLTNQMPPYSSHRTDGCLTEAAWHTHTLRDSDTSSNWMTMKKMSYFWSQAAPFGVTLPL